MQQQGRNARKWGLGQKRSVHAADDEKLVKDSGTVDPALFNPQVAAALGYGRRFGATYQWWVLAVSLVVATGAYIMWAICLFQADKDMDAAIRALRLRAYPTWALGRSLMIVTAVLYPVLMAAAAGVSIWRGALARQLGRVPIGGSHSAPLSRWQRRSRAWQGAMAATTVLLWLLVFFLLFSFAGLCAWAYTSYSLSEGGQTLVDMAGPTWEALVNIATQAQGVVDGFLGALSNLPAIGRRKVLAEVTRLVTPGDADRGSSASSLGLAMPGAGDVGGPGSSPEVAAAVAAGVAAHRALQQLPSIQQVASGLAQGMQQALGVANRASGVTRDVAGNLSAAVNATGLNAVLPRILPSGQDNPLFQTLNGLADRIGRQVFNATGCPVYCIDLRKVDLIEDGCLCNLDRVRAALPFFKATYPKLIPAIAGEALMFAAATWLLLHAASMWGRTRTEGKLLRQAHGHSQGAAAAAAAAAAAGGQGPVSHHLVVEPAASGNGVHAPVAAV